MNYKIIRKFPIKKTKMSFSNEAWIPRMSTTPVGWSKVFKSGTRSSRICPLCCLSPLHRPLSSQTESLLFLKVNMLLHHQAFEYAMYCLAFALLPGWLLFIPQVSATMSTPPYTPTGLITSVFARCLFPPAHPSDCQFHQGRDHIFYLYIPMPAHATNLLGIQEMFAEEMEWLCVDKNGI